eukprot:CAMPEP_0177565884 /NCGR_PEP_ID=MMETSP0369-20130122/74381_1 /TAXON_ID=447022 ORGANISM="Scrippsiella hangoei-like, Strain SHHI-4" /NCGR_SAMPLE_ID=MMETSP0369 /ASSEMBLY_ACC=CAM_ASM_000364 /LENGTH=30 /DNA_ID= /DNA_START= /DNA_END= /DNA_ORIENTATION=
MASGLPKAPPPISVKYKFLRPRLMAAKYAP